MASLSFDELCGSDFHNFVSVESKVQDINFNEVKLKKRNIWEKGKK